MWADMPELSVSKLLCFARGVNYEESVGLCSHMHGLHDRSAAGSKGLQGKSEIATSLLPQEKICCTCTSNCITMYSYRGHTKISQGSILYKHTSPDMRAAGSKN